jgi:arylsulfatase A-like enzyme
MLFFGSSPLAPLPNSFGLEMDVAPTLVDMVGLKKPFSWKGKSLLQKQGDRWGLHFSPIESPDQEVVITYWHQGNLWKYTRRMHASSKYGLDERLSNLTEDPEEKINLIKGINRAFVQLFRDYLGKHAGI